VFSRWGSTTVFLYQRDVPRKFCVTIEYDDDGGNHQQMTYHYDFDVLHSTTLPPRGTEDYLEEIGKTLKDMAKAIGKVSPGGSVVVEQYQVYTRRMQREMLERERKRSQREQREAEEQSEEIHE